MSNDMSILDAVLRLLDGGRIEIYDGKMPRKVETRPRGHVLVTMDLSNPAFRPARTRDGVEHAVANPIFPGVVARGGSPRFFRAFPRDRSPDAVVQGTVGPRGDMSMNVTLLARGDNVNLTDWSLDLDTFERIREDYLGKVSDTAAGIIVGQPKDANFVPGPTDEILSLGLGYHGPKARDRP